MCSQDVEVLKFAQNKKSCMNTFLVMFRLPYPPLTSIDPRDWI